MSKNMIKAVGFATLAGILCFNFLSVSYAKDTDRSGTYTALKGSILVTMRSGEDVPVPGGSLTLYKVGTYIWINTRYLIQLENEFIEDYTSLYLEVESLDPEKAQGLSDLADKTAIEGRTGSIGEDGKVSFDSLGEGLYLITQKEAPQGYLPVKPFFVTIPFFDHAQGKYIYDVDASPKTQKYSRVIPLIPLEPAWHDMAELIPAGPDDGPDMATPSDASSSEPAPADPGAGGSSDSTTGGSGSGQSSKPASHGGSGGGNTASTESVLPDTTDTNTLEIEGGTANINPLPATGEGRKILAGTALCLLSGIALAAAVVKRVKEGGR